MTRYIWLAGGLLLIAFDATPTACHDTSHRHAWLRPSRPDELRTPDLQKNEAIERIRIARREMPLRFEANQGQVACQVRFLSRAANYTVFLTAGETVLAMRNSKAEDRIEPPSVLRMRLIGANAEPRISALEKLSASVNYFLGADKTRWRTNVPSYAKVKYEAVYPGIDLVYYGTEQRLEYDFIVAPGSDPTAIRIAFEGVDKAILDPGGNLVLTLAETEVIQNAPVVYQEQDGVKRIVGGRYVLFGTDASSSEARSQRGETHIGFEVSTYDLRRPLVIDPVLTYATYFGGSSFDFGLDIAVDPQGDAYITGTTVSDDFPTATSLQPLRAGSTDVFVAKLRADGSALIYSTYLGGRSEESTPSIDVDRDGNAVVTGSTLSTDFPTVNALQREHSGPICSGEACPDAFISKMNAAGSALIYSTYLGGSLIDVAFDSAVDPDGSAYVTGWTESRNFPVARALQPVHAGGFFDVFVAKINADGSELVYSTYLGGGFSEFGQGVAVDAIGNASVTGLTDSLNFPTVRALQPMLRGPQDAFVSKIAPDGSALIYSTYLGGSGVENSFEGGIAVSQNGSAVVTGSTGSDDFPTRNPLQPSRGGALDAFVAKLSPDGSAFVYSSYLGGTLFDAGRRVALDERGHAYVIGSTRSPNFPTANPLQPQQAGGSCGGGFPCSDVFVARINPDGSALVYSTFLGGTQDDNGAGVSVRSGGEAFITGTTRSLNFPTVSPLRPVHAGGTWDAFVAKINDSPGVSCRVDEPLLWPPNHHLVSIGLQVAVVESSSIVRVRILGNGEADPSDVQVTPGMIRLRAERTSRNGRIYLIVVVAVDAQGNTGFDVCTVGVPHSQSSSSIQAITAQAATAAAFYRRFEMEPLGFSLLFEGTLR